MCKLKTDYWDFLIICKVSSVQEACAKCLAVHILEFEILLKALVVKNSVLHDFGFGKVSQIH